MEDSSCKKRTIESRLETKIDSGSTTLNPEVERWFKKAEHIYDKVRTMQQKVENVRYFSPACLGKKDGSILIERSVIASKIDWDISKYDDEITRASMLHAELCRKGRYVLILDDLWRVYPLDEVGIPEPTTKNGCKLLLTTRLHDACRRMSCKAIRRELLSEAEALNVITRSW
ncbi:NB-ARC domain containing protein [Parasponia andersonii]|uniref:NB-ARC domain containing protein n=1 Tax=Parasponia andersonii TaxID=3476 RepID=A0A2P5DBD0_PARAD|nr:NB-ARC domain containing protein [Parasponia andersonii]